jgi:hypothetical protein
MEDLELRTAENPQHDDKDHSGDGGQDQPRNPSPRRTAEQRLTAESQQHTFRVGQRDAVIARAPDDPMMYGRPRMALY